MRKFAILVLLVAAVGTNQRAVANNFGVGFSSIGGANAWGTPALSGLWEVAPKHSLQFLSAISSSDPFNFAFGSAYRFTAVGSHNLGWHFGFGFNLGTTGGTAGVGAIAGVSPDFYLNLVPLTGFKFSLGGALSNIRLGFDGGMIFHVTPSPFQLLLTPLSATLGASIHYMF